MEGVPSITVRQVTYERLKREAEPLVDDADSVITRLLDLATEVGTSRGTGDWSGFPQPTAARLILPRSRKAGRRAVTSSILRQEGLIRAGTRVGVVRRKLPPGASLADNTYTASFAANGRDLVWDSDRKVYSVSALARLLASRHGVTANPRSENGFRVFGLIEDREIDLETIRFAIEGRREAPAEQELSDVPIESHHSEPTPVRPHVEASPDSRTTRRTPMDTNSWLEDIVRALKMLGGEAHLSSIYESVRNIRPRPHPQSLEAIVRGTIEDHSEDSAKFKGSAVFRSVHGLGAGYWALS
jgi:hypothetical protein